MTASEKLRALANEAERLDAERDYDLQFYHDVVDRLSLIADVVAAAEPCSDWVYITQEDSDALHAAIIALNDSLPDA